MFKFRPYMYAALLAVAAVPAHAAIAPLDFTPTAAPILSDPTFIPAQGQLQGASSYSYTSAGGDIHNAAGAKTYSVDNSTNALSQQFYYGLTNHVRFGVGMNYDWSHRENDFVNGSQTSGDSDGFTNPSFSFLYRALDQNSYPVSLDFLASYAPDLFASMAGTTRDSGTIARGGDAVGVGMAVGREMRSMTVQGVAGATYYGKSDSENATTGVGSDVNSYWAPYVGVNTQTRLDDRVSLNAAARYTFGADYTGDNGAHLPYSSSQADDANITIGANYQFVPNRVVGTVSYAHDFYSDISSTYASHPTSDTTRTDYGSDTFGVHLQYLFN